MRIEINLPEETAQKISELAKKEGRSRKNYIEQLCKAEVQKLSNIL